MSNKTVQTCLRIKKFNIALLYKILTYYFCKIMLPPHIVVRTNSRNISVDETLSQQFGLLPPH